MCSKSIVDKKKLKNIDSISNFKCGHLNLRILRDGTWLYQGSPINRIEIAKLFSTVLKLDDDGLYYLETPVEKGRIDVDDAPFVIIKMKVKEINGVQCVEVFTNLDHKIIINKENPLIMELNKKTNEMLPYVIVRDNLKALFNRSVYYDLVNLTVKDKDDPSLLGIWSEKIFFELGRLD